MAVTTDAIKELRQRTGVGMGKCKEALVASDGDMEKAITYLREKGVAGAVKKEGRETNEGLIGTAHESNGVAFVEVNSETDFVAKNDVFQDFVSDLASQAVESSADSVEGLMAQKDSSNGGTFDERRTDVIQKIGENIQVRRVLFVPLQANQSIGVYTHLGGKICTAVVIEGAADEDAFARQIAMHVAAASPDYLNSDEVPEDVVNQEREIAKAQMAGKPDNVIEKAAEGKLRAFFAQNCLLMQPYIRDEKQSVEKVVAQHGKEAGKELKIVKFINWRVGG